MFQLDLVTALFAGIFSFRKKLLSVEISFEIAKGYAFA